MEHVSPERKIAPLEGQDLALVAWETPERPMEVAGLLSFGLGPGAAMPTLDEVREAVRPTLIREPRLHQRILRRRLRAPVWESARSFALRQHVRQASAPEEGAHVLLERPLPEGRPPWSIWFVPGAPDASSFTLVLKAHHALLDGASAIAFFERLFAPPGGAARRTRRGRRAERPRFAEALHLVRDLLRRGPATPLTGPVGPDHRHHAFEIDDAILRERSAAGNGSRFDVVLGALSEGVEGWLTQETGEPVPDGLRAFCPVGMGGSRDRLGNRIAPWIVPLGRAERSRRPEHLRAARGGAWLSRCVRGPGRWLARLGMRLAARRSAFHLVVSQVPGLSDRTPFLGAQLHGFVPWIPLLPGLRASVGFCRVGPRVFVGVREAFPDPAQGERLVARLREALTEGITRRSHAA